VRRWSNNGSAYYATLQPDPENNVVMVFDYSTDAVYPSMVYTSRRVTYGDSLNGRCWHFPGAGRGIGSFRALGRLHRHLARFQQLDRWLVMVRGPVRPYIRELGDGDRFSRI